MFDRGVFDRAATRTSTTGVVAFVALLAGMLIGFWTATAVTGTEAATARFPPPSGTESLSVSPAPEPPPAPTTTPSPHTTIGTGGTSSPLRVSVLMWTSGGLSAGTSTAVTALAEVESSTVVRGDQLDLVGSRAADGSIVSELTDGWRIPLDALAVDPDPYATAIASWADVSAADAAAFTALAEGEGSGRAVLTESSAALRGVGVGGELRLLTGTVVVVGVVDDVIGAGAEVVVDIETGRALGVETERYLLIESRASRSAIEAALSGVTDAPLRLRAPGETPYPRHGDAVLPQLVVKDQFGEFAYRPRPGRDVEIDPSWIGENIVTVDLPLVGTTVCHRSVVPQLEAALSDLANRGLSQLIDPAGYAGCFAPRLIAPGLGMSRHAWGIAVDLNAYDNPAGSTTMKDIRLVETMAEQGFGWGGEWLNPDAMHFEMVDPPGPSLISDVTPPS